MKVAWIKMKALERGKRIHLGGRENDTCEREEPRADSGSRAEMEAWGRRGLRWEKWEAQLGCEK